MSLYSGFSVQLDDHWTCACNKVSHLWSCSDYFDTGRSLCYSPRSAVGAVVAILAPTARTCHCILACASLVFFSVDKGPRPETPGYTKVYFSLLRVFSEMPKPG